MMDNRRYYIPETTLTDYMFQEKREEEDLPALKTTLMHPYNDSKTIYKNTKEDSLQPPDTMNNRMTVTRKNWKENNHGRFKRLINDISHDKTWT